MNFSLFSYFQDNGQTTELWLITSYHERGSLYDYLKANTNTIFEAITLCHSGSAEKYPKLDTFIIWSQKTNVSCQIKAQYDRFQVIMIFSTKVQF